MVRNYGCFDGDGIWSTKPLGVWWWDGIRHNDGAIVAAPEGDGGSGTQYWRWWCLLSDGWRMWTNNLNYHGI